MKQLSWLLLLVGLTFNLNAQKAHSKTHKKRPSVYKGSVGLSFNQGLWFPAKLESYVSQLTFLNQNPKYQYGASINTDFKIFKSFYSFLDLGVDRTTFSTNKVILDSVRFSPTGASTTLRIVSYETPNWVRRSLLRCYSLAGLAYKLPIRKHLLIIGIGIYIPFYATFSQENYLESTGRASGWTIKEPIFTNKSLIKYADKYGLLRVAYSKELTARLLLKANINYMMCRRPEGIRQILNLGLGLSYKFK